MPYSFHTTTCPRISCGGISILEPPTAGNVIFHIRGGSNRHASGFKQDCKIIEREGGNERLDWGRLHCCGTVGGDRSNIRASNANANGGGGGGGQFPLSLSLSPLSLYLYAMLHCHPIHSTVFCYFPTPSAMHSFDGHRQGFLLSANLSWFTLLRPCFCAVGSIYWIYAQHLV